MLKGLSAFFRDFLTGYLQIDELGQLRREFAILSVSEAVRSANWLRKVGANRAQIDSAG